MTLQPNGYHFLDPAADGKPCERKKRSGVKAERLEECESEDLRDSAFELQLGVVIRPLRKLHRKRYARYASLRYADFSLVKTSVSDNYYRCAS